MKNFLFNKNLAVKLLLVCLITSVYITVNAQQNSNTVVIVKSIDPLIKVTPDFPSKSTETNSYYAAKGEAVHCQFVVWNNVPLNNFSISLKSLPAGVKYTPEVNRVGYVSITNKATKIDDAVTSSSGLYPDPLYNANAPQNLKANSVTSFWISFTVPQNMAASTYRLQFLFKAILNNKPVSLIKNISLTVVPVSLNTSYRPWFSNWITFDNPVIGGSVQKLQYLNNNVSVLPFSKDYWSKISGMAAVMRNAGQNSVLLSPQKLAKYSYDGKTLKIDFSRFDSAVSYFMQNHVIGMIEGYPICGRSAGWGSKIVVQYVKKDSNGKAIFDNMGNPNDAEVKNYFSVYLSALVKHLKDKNWLQFYYQHVADEPVNSNADSYIQAIKMVKAIAPDLKIIEAIQTTQVAPYIDIVVPQLDILSKNADYFQNLVANGKQVWFYTSWLPQGSYANRFIEQQAIRHRILFWILAKYNLKGVLNWGFNYWQDDPYKNLGEISGNDVHPAGDGWLVYPQYNKVLSSIRLETMTDGMNDYALLQMLKKKNPAAAKQLIDEVVKDYSTYNTDVNSFREVRKKLLLQLGNKF